MLSPRQSHYEMLLTRSFSERFQHISEILKYALYPVITRLKRNDETSFCSPHCSTRVTDDRVSVSEDESQLRRYQEPHN